MNNITSLRVLQIQFLILGRREDLFQDVTCGLRALCQKGPIYLGRQNSKCKDVRQKDVRPVLGSARKLKASEMYRARVGIVREKSER